MGVFGGILDAMNLRDDDYDEDDYEEEMDDEPRRFRRKERCLLYTSDGSAEKRVRHLLRRRRLRTSLR